MKKRWLAGLMTHQFKELPVTMKMCMQFNVMPRMLPMVKLREAKVFSKCYLTKPVNPVSLRLLHPTLGPSCTMVHVQLYRRCLVVTDLAVSSPPGHDLIQRALTSTEVPCCPEPFFMCDVDKHLPLSSWSNGAVSGAGFHLSWHTGADPPWLSCFCAMQAMWPAMPRTGKDWSAVVCRHYTDSFQWLSRHWGSLGVDTTDYIVSVGSPYCYISDRRA